MSSEALHPACAPMIAAARCREGRHSRAGKKDVDESTAGAPPLMIACSEHATARNVDRAPPVHAGLFARVILPGSYINPRLGIATFPPSACLFTFSPHPAVSKCVPFASQSDPR